MFNILNPSWIFHLIFIVIKFCYIFLLKRKQYTKFSFPVVDFFLIITFCITILWNNCHKIFKFGIFQLIFQYLVFFFLLLLLICDMKMYGKKNTKKRISLWSRSFILPSLGKWKFFRYFIKKIRKDVTSVYILVEYLMYVLLHLLDFLKKNVPTIPINVLME